MCSIEAKKQRNGATPKLMEGTYSQRRKSILECPAAIPEVLKKRPFLGNEDEVHLISAFTYIRFHFYITHQNCYNHRHNRDWS